jgi:hypothetical protein
MATVASCGYKPAELPGYWLGPEWISPETAHENQKRVPVAFQKQQAKVSPKGNDVGARSRKAAYTQPRTEGSRRDFWGGENPSQFQSLREP